MTNVASDYEKCLSSVPPPPNGEPPTEVAAAITAFSAMAAKAPHMAVASLPNLAMVAIAAPYTLKDPSNPEYLAYLSAPRALASQAFIAGGVQGLVVMRHGEAVYLYYPGLPLLSLTVGSPAELMAFSHLAIRLGAARGAAYYLRQAHVVPEGLPPSERTQRLTVTTFSWETPPAAYSSQLSATLDMTGVTIPGTQTPFPPFQRSSLISQLRADYLGALLLPHGGGVANLTPYVSFIPPTRPLFTPGYGRLQEGAIGVIHAWAASIPAEAFALPPLPPLLAPEVTDAVYQEFARFRALNGSQNQSARLYFPCEADAHALATRGLRDRISATVTANVGHTLGDLLAALESLSGISQLTKEVPLPSLVAFLLARTARIDLARVPPHTILRTAED